MRNFRALLAQLLEVLVVRSQVVKLPAEQQVQSMIGGSYEI